jgi:hypothetical protein
MERPSMSPRRFFLVVLLACGGARAIAADPIWVSASFAEPASGVWRTQEPLVVRVDVGLRGDDAPKAGLTLSPGQLITLTLTDAAGKTLATKWGPSDGSTSMPLKIYPGQRRPFFFVLSAEGRHRLDPLPGRYLLRATLQSAAGPGWQGRVEAAPLALTVPDQALPEVRVSIPAGGELSPGDPLLVALTFAPTPEFRANDTFAAPDLTARAWREAVGLELRNAAGQTVDLPWAEPLVLPQAGGPGIRRGKSYGPIWLRVPAAALATMLPAGDYTLAVRIIRESGREPITVSPVPLKVLPPAAAAEPDARKTSVVLALIEARALRQRAQAVKSFNSWQDRLFAEAAAGLKRVAPMAEALVRERPTAIQLALLQAEMRIAMANVPEAAVALARAEALPAGKDAPWAQAIAGLRRRLAAPATETDRYFAPHWSKALSGPQRAPAAAATPSVAPNPRPAAASAPVAPPVEDAAGLQWAVSARASSEYRATDYGARQATGAPDVPRYGDSGKAWAPKTPDLEEEWIELTFARPVHATGVRVVQNFNPGAIARIEVMDASGAATAVWSGPDATTYARNEVGILSAQFPRTPQPIAKVKIVVNAKRIPGWNEIDAVALSGSGP